MKWKKYTIQTTTQAEDFISSMLADLGVEGVQVEDNIPLSQADQEKMYIDILPELAPDEGIAYISFFLDAEQEQEQFLVQVQKELENLRALVEIGTAKIMQEETEDKDWINNWKQYFTSFAIDDILKAGEYKAVWSRVYLFQMKFQDQSLSHSDNPLLYFVPPR